MSTFRFQTQDQLLAGIANSFQSARMRMKAMGVFQRAARKGIVIQGVEVGEDSPYTIARIATNSGPFYGLAEKSVEDAPDDKRGKDIALARAIERLSQVSRQFAG